MNSRRMEDILLMCGVKVFFLLFLQIIFAYCYISVTVILLRSTIHIVNPVQLVDTSDELSGMGIDL